jgi:hypothetical protein
MRVVGHSASFPSRDRYALQPTMRPPTPVLRRPRIVVHAGRIDEWRRRESGGGATWS